MPLNAIAPGAGHQYTENVFDAKEGNRVSNHAKLFAERLNHCLDESEAPSSVRERAAILSKMLDISKQQAWNLIEGLQRPDNELIEQIAEEFEVEAAWLRGEK